MSDVVFIALTIVVFGVMALVIRGVERLVGQRLGGEELDASGDRHGDGPGGTTVSVGPVGVGAHPDGQVLR
jgi:hypothetical protein